MCYACGCRTIGDFMCDSCNRAVDRSAPLIGVEYRGWVILSESDDNRIPYMARKEDCETTPLFGESVEDLMEQIDELYEG